MRMISIRQGLKSRVEAAATEMASPAARRGLESCDCRDRGAGSAGICLAERSLARKEVRIHRSRLVRSENRGFEGLRYKRGYDDVGEREPSGSEGEDRLPLLALSGAGWY